MVKKIIDLADASTFTAGAAAQVILPAESLNLPYLVDYLSGASTTPSRTIPIADLLNTPTTKIGVFGAVPNITTNGSRVFTSTSKYNLNPYNNLQFFVNRASDDTWGDEPDADTTFTWSKFGPYPTHTPILQNYGIQPSNAGDGITTILKTLVYFPGPGDVTYTFKFAADNSGTLSIDADAPLLTLSGSVDTNYKSFATATKMLSSGYHLITISLTNITGPMGVAAQILDSNNIDNWHTAPGRYGTNTINESLFLQYSKDGIFWNDIKEILPADIIDPNQWYLQTALIPADAKIQQVYLRIFQVQSNPDNNFADNWAVSSLNAIPVGVSALLNFNDPDSYIAGDATQVSFPSDIANGISQLFNGTSQYFTVGYNSKFNFGADDFTVELWLNMSSAQTAGRVINAWNSATGAAAQWEIVCTGGNAIQFNCSTNGITAAVSLNATGLTTGTWYHVVGSRTGNIFALFVNGRFKATATQAITLQSADTLTIGARRNGASYIEFFNGYVTNVRVVSGRSLYRTAVAINEIAFIGHSPGPLALTAVDNTVLLACQNYTNIDNSTTAATITNVGSTVAGITGGIIISPIAPQVSMPADNPNMSPCKIEGVNRADIRIGILGRNASINADKVRWFSTKDKVSLRGYTGLRFYLNKGNNVSGQWGNSPDTAQAETDGTLVTESFLMQYSADGSNWTTFSEITPVSVTGDNQWYVNDITIPDAIKDSTTYLRYNMNQVNASDSKNDNWAVSPLFALSDSAVVIGGTLDGPLFLGTSDTPIILG
jgi:hypothetical protein